MAIPAGPARADTTVAKGPAESWVEELPVPTADPARSGQIQNGISWLLWDDQLNHRDHGSVKFSRTVYQIVDRPGLEQGAGINLQFDPSRHKVVFNHLRIIRGGVTLDRLPSLGFDIFRQEKDAERGVFDGWLTAHVNIDDVRVGDIVDYAVTYETTPLVGPDLFFFGFNTESTVPVALIRTRVLWPASNPLKIKVRGKGSTPTVSQLGSATSYLWEIRNPTPVKSEDNLPADYPLLGSVEISSTDRWQDIVDALSDRYRPTPDLPADFAAKLDAIATRHPLAEDRMVEAMRLVQDEIRYVSLSMGEGSYIPRDPATVVASGFGDCKDKALLLASALTRLGVSAQVALADLDAGQTLDQHLPTLNDFDHAIVKATIKDRIYWLDATDYLQGGRAQTFPQPSYGFALPLFGSGELEKMPQPAPDKPSVDVSEQFDFPAKKGDPLSLVVTSLYSGGSADAMRQKLASEARADFADSYLKYYSKSYPGLRSVKDLEIHDRREDNAISVKESYELPADALAANDLAKEFPIRPADLGNNLPTPSAVGRTGPVFLGAPTFRRHAVTVRNLKARFDARDIKNVISPYFSLKTSWSNTPTEFEIEWNFRMLASEVPGSDIAAYLKSVDDVSSNMTLYYDFTYEAPPEQLAGDGLTRSETISALLVLSLLVLVPSVLVYEKRTFRTRPEQLYWPMSIRKFVILSFATLGLYPAFWAWRAFKQQKIEHGARYWPFLQGVFLFVFFVPAFLHVNKGLGTRRIATWIGLISGLLLVVSLAWEFIPNLASPGSLNLALNLAEVVIWCIAPIPLVAAVNRLNDARPEFYARNSTFSASDRIALFIGVFYSVFMLYVAFKGSAGA